MIKVHTKKLNAFIEIRTAFERNILSDLVDRLTTQQWFSLFHELSWKLNPRLVSTPPLRSTILSPVDGAILQ